MSLFSRAFELRRRFVEDRPFQFTVKMWTWRVLWWLDCAFFFVDRDLWIVVSVLWVTYISHAAMVATHAGNREAATAAQQTSQQ